MTLAPVAVGRSIRNAVCIKRRHGYRWLCLALGSRFKRFVVSASRVARGAENDEDLMFGRKKQPNIPLELGGLHGVSRFNQGFTRTVPKHSRGIGRIP